MVNLCEFFCGPWGGSFWCRPSGSLQNRIYALYVGGGCRWSLQGRWSEASVASHLVSGDEDSALHCYSTCRAMDWPKKTIAAFDSASCIQHIQQSFKSFNIATPATTVFSFFIILLFLFLFKNFLSVFFLLFIFFKSEFKTFTNYSNDQKLQRQRRVIALNRNKQDFQLWDFFWIVV